MAYVNGLNGNNYSNSIYQNRNVLTGLASGLDTESMIENAMSGYKMKLDKLMQSKTKTMWQQESYRSIIKKMAEFTDKYTSYASPTNLMSGSFFNSAVNITTQGNYQDMIAASGQTKSDIQILGVKQLATSASYKNTGHGVSGTITGDTIDLNKKVEVSNVSGTLSLNYGNKQVDISFSKDEVFKTGQDMVKAINDKLAEHTFTLGDTTYKASDKIEAKLSADGKQIEFASKDGNAVYINDASGDMKTNLGVEASTSDKKNTTIDLYKKQEDGSEKEVVLFDDSKTVADHLSGKKMSVTLNGISKEITLPEKIDATDPQAMDKIQAKIQEQLRDAFGQANGKDKVVVELTNAKNGLSFRSTLDNATLSLEGEPVKMMGFNKNASTFVDVNRSLGEIYGDNMFDGMEKAQAQGKVTFRRGQNGASDYYVDEYGYKVKPTQDKADPNVPSQWVRVDDKGNELYDLKINDEVVGSFNKDSSMASVMNAINGNADAGVSVSYSRTTNQFTFTARESGVSGKIEMSNKLARSLFGEPTGADKGSYTAGQDAILSLKVDGSEMIDFIHSSNDLNIDGLNIKLKGTFGYVPGFTDINASGPALVLDKANADKNAVTFKSTADSSKIVDAVKSMVEDYNAMVKEIKDAYSTLPMQDGKNKYYEPLTDKQLEGMSESAIKAHEEKAKTGILFGDKDLSSLYDRLRQAISPDGKMGADLRSIGITVEYSNGLSTLKLDEQALRQAIEATPDKVKNVFTQSKDNGADSDGLMQAIMRPLDMYGKVHGSAGILVEKAGSPLAPSSIYSNIIQQKLNDYDKQIEKLQTKMNAQIDRYTKQFSQMEQLIAMMNSQSSSLAGLMGGF